MPEVEIAWLSPDGAGGGHGPHGAIRVAGAIPGDLVQIGPVGKRDREAALISLLRPSPDRQPAPCTVDARCGGCDLAAWQPDARRAGLAALVQRAFGLDAPPPVVPSPRERGYRARVQLAIEGGRAGYRGHRGKELVVPDACGIARSEVNAAIDTLQAWLAEGSAEGLTRAELRSDGAAVAFALQSAGPVPRAVRERLAELGDVALDGRALAGDPVRWLPSPGGRLKASPRSFYQVNLETNTLLAAHVVEQVLARSPERVLDAYSGNGNLALPLARQGIPVTAVELDGQALADLRAVSEGLPVEALAMDAEKVEWRRIAFDVAVLDPPRAGTKGVLSRMLANRPRAFVYVACHPVSGARDLREAAAQGYRITDVRCFDMFPDTHHVETVIVAER
ncbi:MAG: class I SAM-dependent RNA methyltransferase [Deltaproteobacteria bacterium]|nr:class I SAM-dependent RNA methyltransferase [Deltaproteobacteria bacterium]